MAGTVGSAGAHVAGTPHVPSSRHTGTWVLRTNTVSFYLRSRLELRPDRLHVETPATILGLVPIGTRVRDVSLEDLTGVRIRVVVHPDRLLVAAALLMLAWMIGLPMLAAAALTIVALGLLFLAIALGMRIEDRTQDTFTVPVCVLQRGVAGAAVRQLERALAARGRP